MNGPSNPQPHAVTSVGNDHYAHDANGNMVTRSEDGVTYNQRWNAFNKLAQVAWQRDGQSCNAQFVYDGDGNRLLKVQPQASMEVTTYYAGNLFEKQFNTTADQLGDGELVSGDCAPAQSGLTDYSFTGQRSETGFGLMDFNARYYSPRLGRFISPDSLVPDPTNARDYNRYMYARGNPLKYNDPSGHTVGPAVHDSNDGVMPQWLQDLTDSWLQLWDNDPSLLGATMRDYMKEAGGYQQVEATYELLALYQGSTNAGIVAEYQNTFANAWAGGELQQAWGLTGAWNANTAAAYAAATIISAPGFSDNSPLGPNGSLNCRCPNPYGRSGGPAHKSVVGNIEDEIIGQGYRPVKEYKIETPGGYKSTRFADVAALDADGSVVAIYQVGKTTMRGNPVAREGRAIQDIERATGMTVQYRPYDR